MKKIWFNIIMSCQLVNEWVYWWIVKMNQELMNCKNEGMN